MDRTIRTTASRSPGTAGAAETDAGRVAAFAVECYWPGVTDDQVAALDQAACAAANAAAATHPGIRYLASILVPGDEVVLFEFEGPSRDAVAETSAQAGIPYQRIVDSVHRSHHDGRSGPEHS